MNKDYKLNVGEIFSSLCRHLSSAGLIDSVSWRSNALETNLERVNYVYDFLQRYGLFPNYAIAWKDDDLSGKYREAGNVDFKGKRSDQALDLYTYAVAYAKTDGESLGLAFANRSAVLFEKQLYRECLLDIERAFHSHYPRKIADKLHRRKSKAESLLHEQEEFEPFEDPQPFIHEPNPTIACSTNTISIENTPQMGRHVIATKDIQIGDVIAHEKPFASVLLQEAALNHCHHCMKLCYNLQPCKQCSYALFCSEECNQAADADYHKYECPILEILSALQISKLNLLALRVVICARKDFDALENFPRTNECYESERYEEIHTLVANTEFRSNADLFERSVTAAVIYEIVRRYTCFFEDYEGEKYHDLFKELLLHHMQTAPSNFHEITELIVGDEENVAACVEIGAGAYSFLSMLNHACAPNVVRHCHGTTIVLRALSPIKKGEQLYDNYGYHYAVMPKAERLKWLKRQYCFDCKCQACLKNWSLYYDLPEKNFSFEISTDDMADLQRGKPETAHRVLKGLLIKAAILEKMKPCKNLSDLQECIKQCYSIFGNKRCYTLNPDVIKSILN